MIRDMTIQDQCVVGVYLGGKLLRAGRVRANTVEVSIEREIDNYGSEEHILKEVTDAIDEVINAEVAGIGIGVPSLVDVARGIVYSVEHIPSWREVHLAELLTRRYGVRSWVNNDANCFTVGEKYFGKGRRYVNMVGVIVGDGLGCGIIADNRLYSGRNGGAGEVGYIPYRDHNYEHYCSLGYFEVKYGLKPKVLLARARKKDKIALAILEQFGVDFGQAIKTILYAFDPECIVIGGPVRPFFQYFEESMWKVLRKFEYERTVESLRIEMSDKNDIAVLGAAALCYDAMQL